MTFYPNIILILNYLISFCIVYSPDCCNAEIFWTVLSGQPTESEIRLATPKVVLSWWYLLFLEPPSSLTVE